MRYSGFLTLLAIILGCLTPAPAQADPPTLLIMPPVRHLIYNNFFERKYNPDFDRRLLEGPKNPHNNQWDNSGWKPQDWADVYGGDIDFQMDRLTDTGIIVDHDDMDDSDPVLEVGHAFVRLSGQEKRRVVEFVDYAYGFTRKNPDGTIYIQYDPTCEYIGIYTKNGLQLQ